MLSIKKLLKGLRILNDSDQSKALELSVDDSATSSTKTTLKSRQTADRTQYLPDADGDLASVDGAEDLTNKTISLSNTTDNKLLLSEATTHKVVDSLITHIDNAGDTELSMPNNLSISVPNTKEIILDGKAVRLPVVNFSPGSPPSGFEGDIVYNSFDDAVWLYTAAGYVALVGGTGADRKLANLDAPTEINADLLPDTNARDLGDATLRWDAFLENVDVNDITVNTSLTVDGTTTINNDVTINGNVDINGTLTTIDSQTLEVADANITVNKGGNDVSAEGAGLTIDRTSTDGSIAYQDSLASKFKVGPLGSESEVITAANTQTLTGEKTFQNLFNLPSYNDATTNTMLNISGGAVVRITGTKPTINEITGLSSGSFGMIINTSATAITIVNQDGGVTAANRIQTNSNGDYILSQHQSVIYFRDSVSQRTRLSWINPQFTTETIDFKLNGSYFDINDIFPIEALDGYTVVPYNMLITDAFIYNVKAGDGGNTRFRLYSKASPASSFVNLFTQDPIVSSSAADGVWIGTGQTVTGCTAPILNASSQLVTAKSILKCDIISLMSGTSVFPEDAGLVIHYLKL